MAKAKTFEQNLQELEKIVAKLESGSVSLDESIALFQKGRTLSKACEKRLQDVELKIKRLVEDESGETHEEEVPPEEAPGATDDEETT